MSLTQQVARGAIWLTAARIGGQVFGLASTIVVARFITPDDYGVFAASMSLLAMVSVFAELPVSQAIVHLRDVDERDYDTAFTIGVLRGLLLAVLMLALAIPLAAFMNDSRITAVMVALAGYVFILGLRNPRMEAFVREMNFSREAWLELGAKFTSFVVAALFAVLLRSYWALVISITAAAAVQVVLSYAFRPYRPRFTLASFKRLFSYSVWVAGSTISGQIYQLIDTLTLGRLMGTATLGTYSIGSLIGARVGEALAAPAARPLFAAFSQIQTDHARVREAFVQSMSFMAVLAVPAALTLVMLAEPVVMIVLGPKWQGAVLVVQIISALIVAHIVYTPMMAMLMGLGKTQTMFLRSALFVLIYLPFAIWAVQSGGLVRLLVVKAVLISALTVVDFMIVKSAIGLAIVRQVGAIARPVLAGLAMFAVYWFCRSWIPAGHETLTVGVPLSFVALLGGGAYGMALLCMWHMAGRPTGIEAKGIAVAEKTFVRARSLAFKR